MVRIVEAIAESRMGFKSPAVRHVNRMGRNVVDGGETIIATADVCPGGVQVGIVGRRIGKCSRSRFAEQLLENAFEKARLVGGAVRNSRVWGRTTSHRHRSRRKCRTPDRTIV